MVESINTKTVPSHSMMALIFQGIILRNGSNDRMTINPINRRNDPTYPGSPGKGMSSVPFPMAIFPLPPSSTNHMILNESQ